jgi:DNA polymerase I-like protein with 3'-5' exonuclease and polymerase domains
MIQSISQLLGNLLSVPEEIVVDTEHLPTDTPSRSALLGVSICWAGSEGVYLPVNHWQGAPSSVLVPQMSENAFLELADLLRTRKLSGWNIEHDRHWIDVCFGIESVWKLDGRVLWYLSDRVQKERGYGLKSAQVALLGWEEAGDAALAADVAAAGGTLKKGQHYLAPLGTLVHYAELDAKSTQLVIEKILAENDPSYDILKHHDANRDYAHFLSKCEREGVICDERKMRTAILALQKEVRQAEMQLRETCKEEIENLEREWLERRLCALKTERGVKQLREHPGRHPRFNVRSGNHRTVLLHGVLGLPVAERTATGLPKSDRGTISRIAHPAAQSFVELSKKEKLLQFAQQYLASARDNRLHFPHSTVATVTERLGGFAPYDLNMPFSNRQIMSAMGVGPGKIGVHMDLVSVEPCLIAGFSGDSAMKKVYKDGKGDIYLDLCLELFPIEESNDYGPELGRLIRLFHKEYDTESPPNSEQKEKFKKLRNVSKIIQLAVGYTGTAYTVSKNLTLAGFPTPHTKATILVDRYWNRFRQVARLSGQLNYLAERNGFIVGLGGRRLYVPKEKRKDSLNRFAQHGGHWILREIVNEIDRTKLSGMRALLPDIHDSTSWEANEQDRAAAVEIFEAAIGRVNDRCGLDVRIRGEIKFFHTLYGLKGKE